ncbi:hypothetical protein HKD37_08G023720 [Glycine soja]
MLMLRFYKNRLGMFTAYYGFLLTMAIEILVFKWRLYPWVIPPSFLHSAATFTPPQPCLHNFVVLHVHIRANLKEEYLVFIAEIIPFLDELVEDGHNISGKDHRVHCSININIETSLAVGLLEIF